MSRCLVGRPGRSTSTLRSISANRAATLQWVSISGCLSCSVACHHGRDTNQTFGQNGWGKVSMFVIWPPQPSRNPTSEWLEVLDRLPAVHGFQPLHGKRASPADGFKHPLQGSFWGDLGQEADHTKGTISTLRGLNDWAFQPIREDTQSDWV